MLKFELDQDYQNPRDFDMNLTNMVCWHNRLNLGDEHSYNSDNFFFDLARDNDLLEDLEETEEYASADWQGDDLEDEARDRLEANGFTFAPLFLIDHSGLSISTGAFGCRFDSGQVGWIYTQDETLRKEGIVVSAEDIIKGEVALYRMYLEDDVWGFIDPDDDTRESCWGFFGFEGIKEAALGSGYTEDEVKAATAALA